MMGEFRASERAYRLRARIATLGAVLATLTAFGAGAQSAHAEPSSEDFYGLIGRGDLGIPSEASAFQQLGVHKARIGLYWQRAKVGLSCTQFDPTVYDGIVLSAAERGITLVPVLFGTCSLEAGGHAENAFPTPTSSSYSTWLEFVSALVKRYGPGGDLWTAHPGVSPRPITVWEAWNEPNVARNNPFPPPGVGSWGIFPERYANFLIDTSAAIKSVSPGATVLIGGLAPAGWQVPEGTQNAPSALQFLNAMYEKAPASGPESYSAAELRAAYDGLAIHPYALNGTADAVKEKVEEARTALNTDIAPGGDGVKKLAITELGWPIKGEGGITVGVDEIGQADRLHQTFSWLRSHADALKILYAVWWFYEDYDDGSPSWEQYAGLRRSNGSSRLSLCAFTALTGANQCPYVPGGYPTQAFINVSEVLHGQPGYASVTGAVTSTSGAPSLEGRFVNVTFQREMSPGVWETRASVHPVIGADSRYAWPTEGVSVGNWRVRVVFPQQGPFRESEPSPFRFFTVRSGYHLVARHSGKCIAVSENSTANGAQILQWSCTAGTSPSDGYTFSLVPFSGGFYQLRVNPRTSAEFSTPKCLDVTGASGANGAKLQQFQCLGESQANQLWFKAPLAGQEPFVAFMAKPTGKCLDVEGVSTANGARLQQWDCLFGGNQQWSLQPVG